jgi:hypothetical protein
LLIDGNPQVIAQARFAVQGDRVCPDATFTRRVTCGTVKGWTGAGRGVPPFTTLGGLQSRHALVILSDSDGGAHSDGSLPAS